MSFIKLEEGIADRVAGFGEQAAGWTRFRDIGGFTGAIVKHPAQVRHLHLAALVGGHQVKARLLEILGQAAGGLVVEFIGERVSKEEKRFAHTLPEA